MAQQWGPGYRPRLRSVLSRFVSSRLVSSRLVSFRHISSCLIGRKMTASSVAPFNPNKQTTKISSPPSLLLSHTLPSPSSPLSFPSPSPLLSSPLLSPSLLHSPPLPSPPLPSPHYATAGVGGGMIHLCTRGHPSP